MVPSLNILEISLFTVRRSVIDPPLSVFIRVNTAAYILLHTGRKFPHTRPILWTILLLVPNLSVNDLPVQDKHLGKEEIF